jgi:hypothetical protein
LPAKCCRQSLFETTDLRQIQGNCSKPAGRHQRHILDGKSWTQTKRTVMSRKRVKKVAASQPSTALRLELPALASRTAARVFLLKATLLAAFCIGLSMSSALWIGLRSFPLVPVVPASAEIEGHVAIILYFALFALAAAALIARWPRWFIAAFLGVMLVFCLEDQTRWQPWVFQYSLLMAVIALVPVDGQESQQRALNLVRLIVAFTYIFSGLQKINSNFMFVDFPGWCSRSPCCFR